MKQGLLAVQQAAVNQPSAGDSIGIDLGDRWVSHCAADASGAIVEEDCVPASADAMQDKFSKLPSTRSAIEAASLRHLAAVEVISRG